MATQRQQHNPAQHSQAILSFSRPRADQSGSLLIGLAAELKDMILKYLLETDEIIGEPVKYRLPSSQGKRNKNGKGKKLSVSGFRLYPAILATCQQLHLEGQDTLYANKILVANVFINNKDLQTEKNSGFRANCRAYNSHKKGYLVGAQAAEDVAFSTFFSRFSQYELHLEDNGSRDHIDLVETAVKCLASYVEGKVVHLTIKGSYRKWIWQTLLPLRCKQFTIHDGDMPGSKTMITAVERMISDVGVAKTLMECYEASLGIIHPNSAMYSRLGRRDIIKLAKDLHHAARTFDVKNFEYNRRYFIKMTDMNKFSETQLGAFHKYDEDVEKVRAQWDAALEGTGTTTDELLKSTLETLF